MIECPDANKVHEDGCCFLCNECTESFSSLAQLQFHIQDKHCMDTVTVNGYCEEIKPWTVITTSPTVIDFNDGDKHATNSSINGEEGEQKLNISPTSLLVSNQHSFLEFSNLPEKINEKRSLLHRKRERSDSQESTSHSQKERPVYMCHVCQQTFTVKRDLTTHQRIHSGEQTHKCALGAQDHPRAKQKMRGKHTMWHTGERAHKCSVCHKAFFQKGHLTQHLMIHTHQRPFGCTLCKKTFIFKFDLNRHMKTHTEQNDERGNKEQNMTNSSTTGRKLNKVKAFEKKKKNKAQKRSIFKSDVDLDRATTSKLKYTAGKQTSEPISKQSNFDSSFQAEADNEPFDFFKAYIKQQQRQQQQTKQNDIQGIQPTSHLFSAGSLDVGSFCPSFVPPLNFSPILTRVLDLLHLQKDPPQLVATICPLCGQNFPNKVTFLTHWIEHVRVGALLSTNWDAKSANHEQQLKAQTSEIITEPIRTSVHQPKTSSSFFNKRKQLFEDTFSPSLAMTASTTSPSSCSSSPQKASPVANNHHEENFNSFPRNINNNSIFPTNFQGNADHKKPLSLNLATLSPNHSMNSFTIKNCPDCEQNRQKQIVMERELAETRELVSRLREFLQRFMGNSFLSGLALGEEQSAFNVFTGSKLFMC